jgi:chromate transporter
MDVETRQETPLADLDEASLFDLFWVFIKIGIASFGGASRAMMHAETVERNRWLREKDFLAGFAIAQVLPGANPVNLALYIGLRLRGLLGATASVLGMLLPAFLIIMLMGLAYRELAQYHATHVVLDGVAAAGVGATLSVGVKVAKRLERSAWTWLTAVGVFLAVGVFHVPMIPLVVVVVPAAILIAWFTRSSVHAR